MFYNNIWITNKYCYIFLILAIILYSFGYIVFLRCVPFPNVDWYMFMIFFLSYLFYITYTNFCIYNNEWLVTRCRVLYLSIFSFILYNLLTFSPIFFCWRHCFPFADNTKYYHNSFTKRIPRTHSPCKTQKRNIEIPIEFVEFGWLIHFNANKFIWNESIQRFEIDIRFPLFQYKHHLWVSY